VKGSGGDPAFSWSIFAAAFVFVFGTTSGREATEEQEDEHDSIHGLNLIGIVSQTSLLQIWLHVVWRAHLNR
jgi:hypothetical protein